MGGGSSKTPVTPDANSSGQAESANVDLQLMNQQLEELFKFKILLLGAGESGKSTVVKQLKLIHKKKMSSKELQHIAGSLHQNVIDCMVALLKAAHTFGYTDFNEEELATEKFLMTFEETQRVTPELGERIKALFHGAELQRTYERRSEFWLLDSWPYYLKHLDRFTDLDYVPTEEDALMARVRTTGIVNSELEQQIVKTDPNEPEVLKFQVVDVGGQRNERKKWLHCFDDVSAILFIVNSAGYNQVLYEDSTKNRMIEELELFESIAHNKLFAETPIFLFLNKKDLFETMIQETDMCKVFADYSGGKQVQPALEYLTEQFQRRVPDGKKVSVHPVTARWKQDIKAAFDDVKKSLYDQNRDELLKQAHKIKTQKRHVETVAQGGGGPQGCGCR